MATVTNGYELPSRISVWCSGMMANDPAWFDMPHAAAMVADLAGFTAVTFCWKSKHDHWQVQWKRRRRLSPAAAELVTSDTIGNYDVDGGDLWEKWPDAWTDLFSGENETACTKVSAPSGRIAYVTAAQTVGYDFSAYDKWECIVRVRVLNSRVGQCSEWVESEVLSVCFCPQITAAAANRDAHGDWTIEIDHNWPRGGNSFAMYGAFAWADGALGAAVVENRTRKDFAGLPDDAFSVSVPGSRYAGAKLAVNTAGFATSDMEVPRGAGEYLRAFVTAQVQPGSYGGMAVADVGAHVDPSGVAVTAAAEADWPSLAITVASTGSAAPETVLCRASWTDARGAHASEEVELSTADGGATWTGLLEYVPFDVQVDIEAAAVKSGSYALAACTGTVPGNGRALLSWPDAQSVCLRYETSRSASWKPDSETVETAGRELPVARYGIGGSLQVGLDGVLLDVSEPEGDGRIGAIEPLKEPHEWVLRLPGGELYRGRVYGVGCSSASSTGNRLLDVSLTMEVTGYAVG